MTTRQEQLQPVTAARRTDLLTVARAEALFSSDLPTGTRPTRAEATAVISDAVRTHGGIRSCATVLAGEYGDHPETAVPRMRWALAAIRALYPTPSSVVATRGFHWSEHRAHGRSRATR
jgi:hypothetical protein